MSARDHLSPDQLRLFATATEVKGMVNYSYDAEPGRGSYDQVHPAPGRPRIVHVPSTSRESLDQTWQRKLTESKSNRIGWVHGAGVHDSIANEGWRPGVSLTMMKNSNNGRQFLVEGHHRIAAAADLESQGRGPYWVPLRHGLTDA